jgi:hypothetical protein
MLLDISNISGGRASPIFDFFNGIKDIKVYLIKF